MDVPPPPPAAEQVRAQTPAMALFKFVCLEGRAQLDQRLATRVSFEKLPRDARRVFGYATSHHHLPGISSPPRAAEAPTLIYRIAYPSETYLILPKQRADTRSSKVCAVITKGDRFHEAKRLIFNRDVDLWDKIPGVPLPYLSTFIDGHRLSAALHNSWTLASTVPESPPVRSQ